MRSGKRVLWALAGATVLLGATGALAVNCEQVRRYASNGRTAEQISDTMLVDLEDVKKCLAEDAKGSSGEKKPEAGAGEKKKD